MNDKTKFTVIGAGHGGKAMAAHLGLMGFTVHLYNRSFDHIAAIKELGGIDLVGFEGDKREFGKLEMVTDNIEEAITGMDMIMVVVPSSAHAEVAKNLAPYLKDGQTSCFIRGAPAERSRLPRYCAITTAPLM